MAEVVYPACPASAPEQCVYLVPPDFMALSPEDGGAIGFLILAVWAAAWAIRRIAEAASAERDPEN